MSTWKEKQTQYFNYISKLEENYQRSAEEIHKYADNAGKLINDAAMANMDTIRQQFEEADAFLAPWRQIGLDASQRMFELDSKIANFDTSALKNFEIKELSDLTGLNGDEALAAASQRVLQGADVQQAIQLGIDSMQRSAMAGSHGIRSGRLAQELQQFGQETSFGALNDRRNILMSMESDRRQGLAQALQMDLGSLQTRGQNFSNLAGLGQQSTSQTAGLAYQMGSDLSNQNMMGAQGLANAEMAKGNAWSNYYNARAEIDALRALATTGINGPMNVLGSMQGGIR